MHIIVHVFIHIFILTHTCIHYTYTTTPLLRWTLTPPGTLLQVTMITSQVGEAYSVQDSDYGKNQQCGRSQIRNSRGNDKSKSKSRKRLVECHYCHKKGHMKMDCYALKNTEREREKGKTHSDGHVMQVTGLSSSM